VTLREPALASFSPLLASGSPISGDKAPCIVYEASRCTLARSSSSIARGDERTIPSAGDSEASARELVLLSGFWEAWELSYFATSGFKRLLIPLMSSTKTVINGTKVKNARTIPRSAPAEVRLSVTPCRDCNHRMNDK
jgi:hypothetical protein